MDARDATDALAIANLKAGYCAAADRAAGDAAGATTALLAVLADDAVADYGAGALAGPAAIADFLAHAIAGGSEWMVHVLGSPRIAVSGDEATGEWAVIVHSRRRDGSAMQIAGRYADRFRREGGGWRIVRIGFARLG